MFHVTDVQTFGYAIVSTQKTVNVVMSFSITFHAALREMQESPEPMNQLHLMCTKHRQAIEVTHLTSAKFLTSTA